LSVLIPKPRTVNVVAKPSSETSIETAVAPAERVAAKTRHEAAKTRDEAAEALYSSVSLNAEMKVAWGAGAVVEQA